jgi:hypothetical protein
MVDGTEAAVVCETCKRQIRWGTWLLFNVVLEDFPYSSAVAEKREGHCGCKGKAYLQSRQPPAAIGSLNKPPKGR